MCPGELGVSHAGRCGACCVSARLALRTGLLSKRRKQVDLSRDHRKCSLLPNSAATACMLKQIGNELTSFVAGELRIEALFSNLR